MFFGYVKASDIHEHYKKEAEALKNLYEDSLGKYTEEDLMWARVSRLETEHPQLFNLVMDIISGEVKVTEENVESVELDCEDGSLTHAFETDINIHTEPKMVMKCRWEPTFTVEGYRSYEFTRVSHPLVYSEGDVFDQGLRDALDIRDAINVRKHIDSIHMDNVLEGMGYTKDSMAPTVDGDLHNTKLRGRWG